MAERRTIARVTPSLVAILAISLVLFGGTGLAMVWFAVFGKFASIPDTATAVRIMMAAFACFLFGLASLCVRPLRHVRRSVAVEDSGLSVAIAGDELRLPWAAIRWRTRSIEQTVTIMDRDGRTLITIPYVAIGAVTLLNALLRNAGGGRVGPSVVPVIQSIDGGVLNALLAAFGIAGGFAAFWFADPESGIPPRASLHATEGVVAWVESSERTGVRFGLEGVDGAFRYPDKSNAASRVADALRGAATARVELLHEPGATTRGRSDPRAYRDIWQLSIDGHVVRSFEETTTAWREDNALMPWLGGVGLLMGLVLASTVWLRVERRRALRATA